MLSSRTFHQGKPMSENKVDTKQIGSRINHEHLLEIEDYVHKEKQKGRKNEHGRPYSRTDYFNEALREYAIKVGIKKEMP
jgi:acyl-CoA reductase-like NAD-dependent aldehyde dehydrogenase